MRLAAPLAFLLIATPSLALAEDCPDPEAALGAAEQAVIDGRFEDADARLTEVEAGFGCGSLATPGQIARMWRAVGARLTLSGDPAAARDAFEGAARLDPDGWTTGFGEAMEAEWRAAASAPTQAWGALGLSPEPTGFAPAVDGSLHEIPAQLPGGLHLVQVLDTDGGALFARTVYLPPGGEVLVETGPLQSHAESEAAVVGKKKHRFPTFLVLAGASAAASGGMAALAMAQKPHYEEATDLDGLNGTHSTQQAFAYSSYGLAGLALTGVVLQIAL